MSNKRLSLAEQIAQIEGTGPVDFDPEDVFMTGAVPGEEEAAQKDISAAREHYVDVGPSTIRRCDSVADPKYEGVRITRKSLMEEDDEVLSEEDEAQSQSGSEEEEEEEDNESNGNNDDDDDEVPPSQGEESEEEEEAKSVSSAQLTAKPSAKSEELAETGDDLSATLRQKREEDRRKGRAVLRQIAIWDALLEARIRLQKAVSAANRLPRLSEVEAYLHDPQCREAVDTMMKQAMLLSDELFDLQEYMLRTNEGVSVPSRKRQKLDDNSDPGYNQQLGDASEEAAAFEHAMHPWLVQTLDKWSTKIQAITPSVLLPAKRNAFLKESQQTKSVVQLVEETLRGHDKLLARTRIRRGKERRITGVGQEKNDGDGMEEEEEDPELFDDTDFYQQLLRDVIDSKGNSGGLDDWMTVQREKKSKKNKVDTKASKGRKIRYQVHEKLQNFMVPLPVVGAWHEEQVDELFASLLGKGYETRGDGAVLQNANNTMAELESQTGGALMSVFG